PLRSWDGRSRTPPGSSGRPGGRGRGPYRLDDWHVAGTATEVPGERSPDRVIVRVRLACEQGGGAHDHARSAEAALQPVVLPERTLDHAELAVFGDALDRRHLGALEPHREERAALERATVDEDRARAALARVAGDLR